MGYFVFTSEQDSFWLVAYNEAFDSHGTCGSGTGTVLRKPDTQEHWSRVWCDHKGRTRARYPKILPGGRGKVAFTRPPPQWFDSVPLEGDVPGFDLPQEDFWNVSAQYMEQRGEIVACFDISIAELISGQPMRTCACLGGANI